MFRIENVEKKYTTINDLVNYLDLPDDIAVSPIAWSETGLTLDNYFDNDLNSEDVSPPIIDFVKDYDKYEVNYDSPQVDPWLKMKEILDTFPKYYLEDLKQFESETNDSNYLSERFSVSSPTEKDFGGKLSEKFKKYFDNECTVFSKNDPSLKSLEEGLKIVSNKLKNRPSKSEYDLESMEDFWWRRSFPFDEFTISPPTEYLLRAAARTSVYELPGRPSYNEERCKEWVEENFIRRLETI